jgi:hypothetical protein
LLPVIDHQQEDAPVPQFPFPVGVLLFNRPEYAEKTLRGLADQTLPVAGKRVVIVIDGYPGSKAQKSGQPDRTAEVEGIARAVFPDAHISISPHNVGIAHAFDLLEKALRDCDPKAEWYGFFEEDYVPNSTYLATIAALATQSAQSPRIAAVSATGEIFGEVTRGADSVYPLSRLWAFLMRASHLDRLAPHATMPSIVTLGSACAPTSAIRGTQNVEQAVWKFLGRSYERIGMGRGAGAR